MSMKTTSWGRQHSASSSGDGRSGPAAVDTVLLYDLQVETRGGVYDLGRVVSVLALLELTPQALTAYGDAEGLRINARLAGEPRACELCISRIKALVGVKTATLEVVEPEAASEERR